MAGVPEPGSGRSSRDRLSRIGHHFLSEERRRPHITLFAGNDGSPPLRAIDLARALARLGTRVAIIEPEHGTILNFRLLPEPDTIFVTGMRGELRGGQTSQTGYADPLGGAEVMINESTTTGQPGLGSLVLLAVPADAVGMRRAWLDLKALANETATPAIGVTITDAINVDEAEYCYRKFAGAAERFLGMELFSYACLLRDRQNHHGELRNIASLLITDFRVSAGAALSNNPPEE